MLLVVGSARGEATYGGAGVVAFCFPSVRLCAGGGALRTPTDYVFRSGPRRILGVVATMMVSLV